MSVKRDVTPAVSGTTSKHPAAVVLPALLVLPIVAFSIIPGIVQRLFVLLVISLAGYSVIFSTGLMQLMAAKDWKLCAFVYELASTHTVVSLTSSCSYLTLMTVIAALAR